MIYLTTIISYWTFTVNNTVKSLSFRIEKLATVILKLSYTLLYITITICVDLQFLNIMTIHQVFISIMIKNKHWLNETLKLLQNKIMQHLN